MIDDPYAYPTDCDLWNMGMSRDEYEADEEQTQK